MPQKIFDLIKGTQHEPSCLTQSCVKSRKAMPGNVDQEYATGLAIRGRGVRLTLFVTKCLLKSCKGFYKNPKKL